jgi:hypothetical protein
MENLDASEIDYQAVYLGDEELFSDRCVMTPTTTTTTT